MKKAFIFIYLFCAVLFTAKGQYAPQAGLAGSTAISAASGLFTGWATQCTVQRGYMDIANPSLGYASSGDSSLAIGAADGSIVSLGDSGIATLTFAHPIYDGPGADIAVFENGFRNPTDSTEAFLELAFVEVSSDGINYFRFPANSNTPTNTQIPGSGVYMDASLINNLAGKYIAMYGTPFDLSELSGTTGLDINNVTHVRVIDVIGSVSGHSSLDNTGHIINDPYPTAFPTGGFDLDAVGALHQMSVGIKELTNNISVTAYPNPVTDNITISVSSNTTAAFTATITSVTGKLQQQLSLYQGANKLNIAAYPAGLYFLTVYDANGSKWVEKLIKQ